MNLRFRTHHELTCLVEGEGTFYAKKGTMVAYQGKFKFEKVLIDTNGENILKGVLNQVVRRVTGENMELMEVKGKGICYLADDAQHVTVIDLQPGDSVSVESENLLAFTENCKYSVRFIGVGVISQKGLFTSKITGKSAGTQVAVKTDGNPIILTTPCVVDPDAVVCWSGPDPSFKIDVNWKTVIGQTSGESYALEFKEPGYIVVVQPSERLSGLKLGIDDKRYQPQSQSSAFANTFNLGQGGSVSSSSHVQNHQNTGGITGNSLVDGIIGNLFNGDRR